MKELQSHPYELQKNMALDCRHVLRLLPTISAIIARWQPKETCQRSVTYLIIFVVSSHLESVNPFLHVSARISAYNHVARRGDYLQACNNTSLVANLLTFSYIILHNKSVCTSIYFPISRSVRQSACTSVYMYVCLCLYFSV